MKHDDTTCGQRDGKSGKPCIRSAGLKVTDNARSYGMRRHPVCALWPEVEGEKFDELVADIKARGLDDDIVTVKIDGETFILDGWNRSRACAAAGVKPRFTAYIGKKDLVSLREYVDARNAHRRHLTKSQLAMIAALSDKLCQGNSAARADKGKTQAERAKASGVSARHQRKADRVADNATLKVQQAVLKGKMSVEAAEPLSKLPAKKQDELAEQALAGSGEIKSGKVKTLVRQEEKRDVVRKLNNELVGPLPTGPFRLIRLDPAWPYENADQHEGSRGHMPYPAMSIADICRLRGDIDKVVHEEGTILALDVPNAFIHEVGRVLEALGFTHRTMITWDKGSPGLGTWCRGQTEHLVIATRGLPEHTLNEVTTLVRAKRREHSRKPDELADVLSKHCPGPRLEMFAREQREGWVCWGVEPGKFPSKSVA